MSLTEADDPLAALDIGIGARLCVALEASTAAMERQQRERQRLFADVSYFEAPAWSTTALPYSPPGDQYGPKDGFWWAVQRITIAGLGATTDFINLYKGSATIPNRALFTFQEAVAGGVATWHPGRTGLMLNGRGKETLAIGGTFTGTTVYVSSDVIQVTEAELAYFLL